MSEFRSGYGQAKADLLKEVDHAIDLIIESMGPCYFSPPSEKNVKDLMLRLSELRRMRAVIKAMKSPR